MLRIGVEKILVRANIDASYRDWKYAFQETIVGTLSRSQSAFSNLTPIAPISAAAGT